MGYWGPVDSNVEWCEPNYAVSPYIAEFGNTLSSLPMVVFGLWGAHHTWRSCCTQRRFQLGFLGLALVGIGSAAFHATLRRYAQLLDELPMLWCNLVFLYCVVDRSPRDQPRHPWLAPLLFVFGTIATVSYLWANLFPIFIASYGGVLAFIVLYSLRLVFLSGKADPVARRLWIVSFSCYFGGLLLWVLDNNFCPTVQPFHFHSLWHLGAGLGTYLWVSLTVALHAPAAKKKAKLSPTALPYILYHQHV
eukprot:TRINITY_DN10964_c0_g1_i1.p1 TRINITY_DN10964_c0_g1~~TRINITY_DN10964_c0_g1_i1.p1  ORF type:complete len:260 (+),score=47.51 TRINITY_DN10964_c0_g1_i1:36-782(+)